jgi:metal-responsive CopG/Arc/MetJ family transcriptional regulator
MTSAWQSDLEVTMASEGRTRLTIDLPKALVEQADMLVRRGVARSRNRLIVEALERFLKDLEEAQINVQFAEMARDERYIEEQLRIAHEFERSDWEALQLEEGLKRQ